MPFGPSLKFRKLRNYVCKQFSATADPITTVTISTKCSFHCQSDDAKTSAIARQMEKKIAFCEVCCFIAIE